MRKIKNNNNNQNDLNKMFLILAAATALNVAHRPQPNTVLTRLLNLPTAVTQNVNHTAQQEDNTLDAEKLALIQIQVTELLNQLGIDNLQHQPAEEQKKAAYKILRHILATTTNLYDYPEETNKDNSALNSIYQSLCAGVNIDSMTSESMALSLLYQQAGLNSKCITVQKQPQHVHDVTLERAIVMIDFADGQRICDPIHTKVAGANTKQRDNLDGVFITPDNYFNIWFKDYQIVSEQSPLILNDTNQVANSNINNYITPEPEMER